jgi:hypothetical protein
VAEQPFGRLLSARMAAFCSHIDTRPDDISTISSQVGRWMMPKSSGTSASASPKATTSSTASGSTRLRWPSHQPEGQRRHHRGAHAPAVEDQHARKGHQPDQQAAPQLASLEEIERQAAQTTIR